MNKIPQYTKETGLIIRMCEIKIEKSNKKVVYTHYPMKVIVSNDKDYVVENHYGGLQIINKLKAKYNSHSTVNKIDVGEQRWGMKYLDDYIFCRCISTFSESVTKNRIKKALLKFIREEAYFYSGLEYEIEEQLQPKPNQ